MSYLALYPLPLMVHAPRSSSPHIRHHLIPHPLMRRQGEAVQLLQLAMVPWYQELSRLAGSRLSQLGRPDPAGMPKSLIVTKQGARIGQLGRSCRPGRRARARSGPTNPDGTMVENPWAAGDGHSAAIVAPRHFPVTP